MEYSKEIRLFYDSCSEHYDQMLEKVRYKVPTWLAKKWEGQVDEVCSVLDLACGNGNIGILLRSLGCQGELTGIDLSPNMVAQCIKSGIYKQVIEGDLKHGCWQTLPSASYDLILAFGVMEFLEDIERILKDIALALSANGTAWISFETGDTDSDTPEELLKLYGFPVYHRTKDELNDLVANSGLVIDKHYQIKEAYYRSYTGKHVPWEVLVLRHLPDELYVTKEAS